MRCSVSETTLRAIDSRCGESTREILGGASGINPMEDPQVEQGVIWRPSILLRIASPRPRRYIVDGLKRKDKTPVIWRSLTTVLTCFDCLRYKDKNLNGVPFSSQSDFFFDFGMEQEKVRTEVSTCHESTCAKTCVCDGVL